MSNYLLLLYAPEVSAEDQAEREREWPEWVAMNERLSAGGLLEGANRLYPVDTATTVRVRDDEVELTDGPFAVTKEMLVGYYLLDCEDLDQAIKLAGEIPLAKYGSVEVRPVMAMETAQARYEEAAGGTG